MKIIRSRLILPINVEKYVEKAYTRNADAIVLDLEDSIPFAEKITARDFVKPSIEKVQGGSLIYIRVNSNDDLLLDDVKASIEKGVEGIVLPKVESEKTINEIDKWMSKIEREKGIEEGTTKISVLIETVEGYFNIDKILKSSSRIDTVTLGVEDFALDAGIESSVEGHEILVPKMDILFSAKNNNIMPLGIMGSMINYKDIEGFEKSAEKAHGYGFLGASCIHPGQVEILNKSFSPNEKDIVDAQGIIKAFETALKNQRASTEYNGKMIDYPLYDKAKKLLIQKDEINKLEKYKMKTRSSK